VNEPAGPVPLSDDILSANRVAWNAMQTHRFVRDIEADRLDPAVFRRYLVYESAFVADAIAIFAAAVAKAPGITEQRWLIRVLSALANDQIGYFEDTFRWLGLEREAVPQDAFVDVFCRGMRQIAADGSYLDIVTAMFCAEWMYWTWCSRAAKGSIADPVLRRWIGMHAEEAFADQARWLKRQVDRAGADVSIDRRRQLSRLFGHVLQMEIDFHSAPYSPAG
jgi:thiaminase (transcriptional activator TenA)